MRIIVQRLTEASKDNPQRRTTVGIVRIARVLDGVDPLEPAWVEQPRYRRRRQRLGDINRGE